jgi:hypothetical protein
MLLLASVLGGCKLPEQPAREPHPEDLGPDQIPYEQLSTYPEGMQADYVLFAKRCSKCHTLARPLNSRFVSQKFWARYVTEMWRRPASGMTHEEVRRIIDFLVYDAKVRKLDREKEFLAHRRQLLEQFRREHPDRYEQEYAGHEPELLKLQ